MCGQHELPRRRALLHMRSGSGAGEVSVWWPHRVNARTAASQIRQSFRMFRRECAADLDEAVADEVNLVRDLV